MLSEAHPLRERSLLLLARPLLLTLGILAIALLAPAARGGVTFTTLVSFDGTNGANLIGTLVQGRDGNLYGVTGGSLFKMTTEGTLTTLASFNGTNGILPHAGLVLATDGDFYGTTGFGSESYGDEGPQSLGFGTVFRITPEGVLTTLVSFKFTNGASPMAELVEGADGNLYGTTSDGGPYHDQNGAGCGTIFRVTRDGVLTTLLPFNSAGNSGYSAWGPLVQGSDGQFYGTTRAGGALTNADGWGSGTFFKIDSAGAFTVLSPLDGTNVSGSMFGLVQDANGSFYWTGFDGTNLDSWGNPLGNVFRATPEGLLTTLVSFNGTNGALPRALMLGTDGNFYGLTGRGGADYSGPDASGHGTVFQMTPGGTITTLVSLAGTNGDTPFGGLVQGWDGNLYGMTMDGGAYGYGTIFRLSVPMPPVLQAISQTGTAVALTRSAVAGQRYQLQYRTNLSQTNWIDLGSACRATNGTLTASDMMGADPQRLYRVALLP